MLTWFMNFRVPAAPDVTIYRDHADPQQFYLIPERPRIAVDAQTGKPVFAFTLFSRNIDIAYASATAGQPVETQLGQLTLTVDLSVSAAEMTAITAYLTTLLTDEVAKESAYNKLFANRTTGTKPRIGYVTWQQGTVKFEILENLGATFKRTSSTETTPSLQGNNAATLWATFGTEGAQLLWDTLKGGKRRAGAGGGGSTTETATLYGIVRYELKVLSRLPALRVTVKANGSTVYQELRKRITVHERAGNSSFTYPQISELVKSLRDERFIEIKWDDWGVPEAEKTSELESQLEQTVLNMITTQIVQSFFNQFQLKGIQDDDLGETFTHTKVGAKGSRLWLNEYKEEFSSEIGFSLERTQNYLATVAPNTSLLANLTDEQVEQLVRIVDVGSPEVQVLTVSVYTNADFQADRIANITVALSYRQFDTMVEEWIEKSESYTFRTGAEVFVFRTRLARDAQGKLLDLYDAKAQINYIGVAHSPPAIEYKNVSDRALTFSYDRLGYVKVEVQAGDIDWTQIKDVFVDLVYEGAQNEPDAKGTVHLTDKELTGRWSTSKHGSTSNRYRYTVRYVFKDGNESKGASVSDDRGSLVIHDTLVGRIRRTFDVVLDAATVESIFLKVRYEDPPNPLEEKRNLFTSTGSWEYVRPLRQSAPQEIRYSYSVQYKDGLSEDVPERTLQTSDELATVKARRYKLSASVDGGGLDWRRFRLVVVELVYRDDAHEYVKTDELRITEQQPFQAMEILAFSPEARAYSYRATFVTRDGTEPFERPEGGGQTTRTGLLLLETLI